MTDPDPDPDTDTGSDATSPEMRPATSPASADSGCSRLTDFDTEPSGWFVVNDGVMGGRSNGAVAIADSTMRFTGTIVTDGGGFTSVRRTLDGTDLVGSDRIEMRIRADERVYGLILDDEHRIDGRNVSFRSDIDTGRSDDTDEWTIVSVDYDSLTPTIFGRVVDAPPFVPGEATEIGIIIADGVDGDFTLEIDWIDACGGE